MATVAVVGATGGVGSKLVEELLEAGHAVRALARRPEAVTAQHEQLEVVRADVTEPDSLRAGVNGVDMVLSCLGNTRGQDPVTAAGTENLLAAMAAVGVERLAVISSAGIGDSAAQATRSLADRLGLRLFTWVVVPLLLRETFADLARMEAAVTASPVRATIVRPVGLTDAERTGAWIAGDAQTPVRGRVARADVAAFMASLVEDRRFDDQAVTVSAAG